MDISDLLAELLDAAYEELKDTDHSTDDLDSVYLLIDESFGDCFSFCLKKNNTEYLWERKRWDKKNDVNSATNPIEQLKYIGRKILPSILTQNGVTQLEEAKAIFLCASQNLDLNKNAVSSDIVLDGVEYSIKISLNKRNEEYKWNALPSGWEPLEELVEMILDLNRKVA